MSRNPIRAEDEGDGNGGGGGRAVGEKVVRDCEELIVGAAGKQDDEDDSPVFLTEDAFIILILQYEERVKPEVRRLLLQLS